MDYAAIALAYLLGSIPFGLLFARMAGLGDITRQGSGNIGATNVLRVGGRKLGLLTLLFDSSKGAVAVLLAARYLPETTVLLVAAASVVGHVFPIWLKGKGGKGVATTLAVLLLVAWPVGVGACLIWLGAFLIWRISSLSAIISMALSPFLAFFMVDKAVAILALFLAILVIARHHANIRRLLDGTEKRSKVKK